MTEKKNPTVVVGDGWAALAAVGFLARSHQPLIWIPASASRWIPPLPSIEAGPAAEAWTDLADCLGISTGPAQVGSYLREFKNKAFRPVSWAAADEEGDRQESYQAELIPAERMFIPFQEARFEMTLSEVEEAIRAALSDQEKFPDIRRIEKYPVVSVKLESGALVSIRLGSGEEIACENLIFADRWATLGKVTGLPKPLSFLRKRDPQGLLQILFQHDVPMGLGMSEGFGGSLRADPGEKRERRFWGHFSSDGKRSVWTMCIPPEQAEDNHEIGKKLRQMKNALNKMFVGEGWLPSEKAEFTANVIDEQVRFEESLVFGEGNPMKEPVTVSGAAGILFMTDGYGPASALEQVTSLSNLFTPVHLSPSEISQSQIAP